jgi:hypothetical protein
MYCLNCGAELKDGAGFCTSCGKPVQPVGPAANAAQTQIMDNAAWRPDTTEVMQPVDGAGAAGSGSAHYVEAPQPVPPKKTSKGLIAAVVVVALALVGILAALVFGGVLGADDADEDADKQETKVTQKADEVKPAEAPVGNWNATKLVNSDGSDEIPEAGTYVITLEDDGTCKAMFAGTEQKGTWEVDEDGKGSVEVDGKAVDLSWTARS